MRRQLGGAEVVECADLMDPICPMDLEKCSDPTQVCGRSGMLSLFL